ncbi:hypothetical protein WA158_005063 [Blastocystis sp. Blastoise]
MNSIACRSYKLARNMCAMPFTRFATTQISPETKRVNEFNQKRSAWKKQMTSMRKEYADEWKYISQQMDHYRAEKVKANYREKKITPEELKQKKMEHEKRAWETLNQSQLSKQVKHAKSLVNQRETVERQNKNIHMYLDSIRPLVDGCYTINDVKERLEKDLDAEPKEFRDLFRVTDEALFPVLAEPVEKVAGNVEDEETEEAKPLFSYELEDEEVNQEREEDEQRRKEGVEV